MKRTLLLVVVFAALAVPITADAAVPCRTKIFTDWRQDGKIASTYPRACYVDALRHLPADAAVYSSLSGDIKAALQASIARRKGKTVPTQVGKGFKPVVENVLAAEHSTPHDPAAGRVGVGATVAHTAGSTPLPILILGVLALVLVAAGAIGAGVRHVRNRS